MTLVQVRHLFLVLFARQSLSLSVVDFNLSQCYAPKGFFPTQKKIHTLCKVGRRSYFKFSLYARKNDLHLEHGDLAMFLFSVRG